MKDEIAAVKEGSIKLVEESRNSHYVPDKYILVTFSDPESLTTAQETSDWREMITMLSNIAVDGGDDCPEYAMSGMLTGRCYSITRKRDTKSHKRNTGYQLFEEIAKETGGKVYMTNTSQLGVLVETVVKETLLSSVVNVIWYTWSAFDPSNVTLDVNNSIKSLSIHIFGPSSSSEVILQDSAGKLMTLSADGITYFINSNIMKITIEVPTPGNLTLARNIHTSTWNVNVTAQSEVDFSPYLLETAGDGISYQVYSNPDIGFNYTLAMDVQNLPENASVEKAFLLDNTWSVIEDLDLIQISSEGVTRLSSEISLETKTDGIKIEGFDSSGNAFARITRFEIRPVGVRLRVILSTNDFEVNKEETITYEVTNTGDVKASFKVNVSDDKGYLTSHNSTELHLKAGENLVKQLYLNASKSGSTVTVQIFAFLWNSSEVLQKASRRYYVSDIQRLQCLVTYKSSDCPVQSLTTKTCGDYKWNGGAEITFSLKMPSQITTSHSDVKVEYDNITLTTKSLRVNVSGHCCVQSAQLNAYDDDGYAARCEFIISNGTIQAVEPEMTTVLFSNYYKSTTTKLKQTPVHHSMTKKESTTITSLRTTTTESFFKTENLASTLKSTRKTTTEDHNTMTSAIPNSITTRPSSVTTMQNTKTSVQSTSENSTKTTAATSTTTILKTILPENLTPTTLKNHEMTSASISINNKLKSSPVFLSVVTGSGIVILVVLVVVFMTIYKFYKRRRSPEYSVDNVPLRPVPPVPSALYNIDSWKS